jgi:Chitin binding Peritrophin-A domain
MKLLSPFSMALAIVCVNGLPSYYNSNSFTFTPCADQASLKTLWPDFEDNTIFYQCIAIGVWGTHSCPPRLLFSFWKQVCVWPYSWVAPPPPDQITPFPTTQWPGTTEEQEVTVPTNPPTPPTPSPTPPTTSTTEAPTEITTDPEVTTDESEMTTEAVTQPTDTTNDPEDTTATVETIDPDLTVS